MIPLFVTDHSVSGILTTTANSEIEENKPISIFAIASTYNLKSINVCDDSFSSFWPCFTSSQKLNIPFEYYIRLNIQDRVDDKNSLSKICLRLKNTKGYHDAIQVYNASAIKPITWQMLNELVTDNIEVLLPFYSSFLAKYAMNYEFESVAPSFLKYRPVFMVEEHSLPFDSHLKAIVEDYCKNNHLQTRQYHTIYYYKNEDALTYCVSRCMNANIGRKPTLERPQLDMFGSNEFSWEHYQQQKDFSHAS